MQLLNENQSWDMLREKVYGEEPCPAELGDIGKTISKSCKGLPLAIVVIAGLLKSNKTKDYWKEVALNTKAVAATDYDQLLGILSLSYTNLPPQLKACFLYVGAFPEDYEFQVKKLVMLWTAEGFLKPKEFKTLENIAEECIEELVERSLFLVKTKTYNGKIKTFSIHDVLREVSMKKAKEEKFLQQNSTSTIQNITNDLHKVSYLNNYLHSSTYNAHLHSFKYQIPIVSEWKVKYSSWPVTIDRYDSTLIANYPTSLGVLCKTTSLRYLYVVNDHHNQCITFPKSIFGLPNLETFITRNRNGWGITIPLDIWKLQRIRHIVVGKDCKLQFPVASERGHPILESLQTLCGMRNVNFSMDVIEKIPNVKRMKLFYKLIFKKYHFLRKKEKSSNGCQYEVFSLINLQHLHQLEELSIKCEYDIKYMICGPIYYLLSDLAFPPNLKKLSLFNTYTRLENFMSIVGSLPNLEVLKLELSSIVGDIWEPVEGEFLQLKYLKMAYLSINEWRVESFHFPCLGKLEIISCTDLREVPESIGEIDTLEELVLEGCRKAKESVLKILENQQAFGNDSLKIIIIDRD